MKVLVAYSSLTGNTRRLAEGIYEAITEEKTILPVSEAGETDDYDVILVGSYITNWNFSSEALDLLLRIKGKKVGLFGTLTYWPDSDKARASINRAAVIAELNNKVIAKYLAQGSLSEKIREKHKNDPLGSTVDETAKRFELADLHPSRLEIALAGELFAERLKAGIDKTEI